MAYTLNIVPNECTRHYIAEIDTSSTVPASSNVTLSADASEGDTTLAVNALTADIPAGQLLTFVDGGEEIGVITQADAATGDVSLEVTRLEGRATGISQDIASGSVAEYNGMLLIKAGTDAPASENDSTQDNQTTTFQTWAAGASVARKKVTGSERTLEFTGLMVVEDPALAVIKRNKNGSGFVYFVEEYVREDGSLAERVQYPAQIYGYSQGGNVDDDVEVSYTVEAYGQWRETGYDDNGNVLYDVTKG